MSSELKYIYEIVAYNAENYQIANSLGVYSNADDAIDAMNKELNKMDSSELSYYYLKILKKQLH